MKIKNTMVPLSFKILFPARGLNPILSSNIFYKINNGFSNPGNEDNNIIYTIIHCDGIEI